MPTLNLFTNVPVDSVVASDILKDATKAVAKIIGKPESVKYPNDYQLFDEMPIWNPSLLFINVNACMYLFCCIYFVILSLCSAVKFSWIQVVDGLCGTFSTSKFLHHFLFYNANLRIRS